MTLTPGARLGPYEIVAKLGQRFLIGTILDRPNAAPPTPTIVLNWK